jgi:hypothetical protein
MTANSTLRVALGCALGFAVVLAWTPARAADGDDAPDVKFFRSILEGIGLQRGDGKSIDYHERSPLVIPPSRALLPPETDATAKNPNWPVDPEIKREKQAKAAERAHSSEDFDKEARSLRPDELTPGSTGGARRSSSRDAGAMTEQESARPMKPSELGYKGGMLSKMFGKGEEKPGKFTGEPARASLTDPPPGYQTPSPNEPYGKEKGDRRTTPYDYATQHGTDAN